MRREEAEQALAGLGAAYDRIAAAMFAIDGHQGLVLLRDDTLTGATRARAQVVRPEVDLLWAQFALLGGVLDRARTLGAGRRPGDREWGELELLLTDRVAALDHAGMPLDGTGTNPVATRLRLAELSEQVERRGAAVLAHLSEVDGAWMAVAGRITQASEAVDAVTALAVELGQPEAATPVRDMLAETARIDGGDPLAAAPGGRIAGPAAGRLADLDREVVTTRQRLTGLRQLRDGYPDRFAALRRMIDEVAQAEQAVVEAQRRATEKIVEPGLGQPPAAAPVLGSRLADLDRVRLSGDWVRLDRDMSTVEDSARRARQRAEEMRAVADGLLHRRDELRGRLDAYRVKAARHGLAEHDALTQRYDAARALLFSAPCDLRASTKAVYSYQQTVASLVDGARPANRRGEVDD